MKTLTKRMVALAGVLALGLTFARAQSMWNGGLDTKSWLPFVFCGFVTPKFLRRHLFVTFGLQLQASSRGSAPPIGDRKSGRR
jgi:hypothetical protein